MKGITERDAVRILEPYLQTLVDCIIKGTTTYYQGEDYGKLRVRHSNRTDSSIVHDLITDEAWNAFDGKPGVRLYLRRGLKLIEFHGEITLRFKKFTRRLKSSNIPTTQAMSYIGQLEFSNMPDHARLQIGYVLSKLRTGAEGVYLTFPNGTTNIWHKSLVDYVLSSQTTLIPDIQSAQESVPAKRRLRAKANDQGKEQTQT